MFKHEKFVDVMSNKLNVTNKNSVTVPSSSFQINHSPVQNLTQKNNISSTVWQKVTKIKINKRLIPLKFALFLWFGVGAVLYPFIQVYFKQIGITLYQISLIQTFVPPFQILAPSLSGIIADKIGKTKPILIVNLLLSLAVINVILNIPNVVVKTCPIPNIDFSCNTILYNGTIAIPTDITCSENYKVNMTECNVICASSMSQNVSHLYWNKHSDQSKISEDESLQKIRKDDVNILNDTLTVSIRRFNGTNGENFCSFDASRFSTDKLLMWCEGRKTQNCSVHCIADWGKCEPYDNSNFIFIFSMIMLFLYYSLFSNTYRILDVTSMKLVKEQKADFGQQRIWSVLSIVILSPLAGYLIQVTSPVDGPRNYAVAFYLGSALILLCFVSIYYLDIEIEPPGKKMLRNTWTLMKNPDVVVFVMLLLVLGSNWCFAKLYSSLYLLKLNGSSILIGLLPAVSSLIGLPFLVTSNWWLKKLGANNLFLLALLAHGIYMLCYSFLEDPWWSVACEIPSIFSYHLVWVAVVTHSHTIAPVGLTATVIATAGGIHYGIGKGLGSVVGGMIMSEYSGPAAYRVMALICVVTAILYCIYIFARSKLKKKNTAVPCT